MKAILIDPVAREVRAFEYDNSSYKNIATAIHAELFTLVRLDEVNSVFVDDEGRINGRGKELGGFRIHGNGNHVELAGYGLVLGSTDEGEAADTTLTVEHVASRIEWLDGQWFVDHPVPPMQVVPMSDDEFWQHMLGPSA